MCVLLIFIDAYCVVSKLILFFFFLNRKRKLSSEIERQDIIIKLRLGHFHRSLIYY